MKAQLCYATTEQGLPRAGDGEFVDGKFTLAKNEINPSLTEVWFFQLLCIHIDTFGLEALITYVKLWCKPSSSSIVELEALYKQSKNKH